MEDRILKICMDHAKAKTFSGYKKGEKVAIREMRGLAHKLVFKGTS